MRATAGVEKRTRQVGDQAFGGGETREAKIQHRLRRRGRGGPRGPRRRVRLDVDVQLIDRGGRELELDRHRLGGHHRGDRREHRRLLVGGLVRSDQGGVDLRRAEERRRLEPVARRGPQVRRRRSSAPRSQTTYKENVPEGPQAAQVIEDLVRDGNKIIFATSFGYQDAMVGRSQEVSGRQVRAGDGHQARAQPRRVLRRRRGHRSTSRDGRRSRDQVRPDRLRRAFAIPEVIRDINAFALGVQADQPERDGQGRLDELVVRRRTRRRRPRRASRRRARTCSARTSTARRPARSPRGQGAVGRLRLEAIRFGPKTWLTALRLQLGPVLPEAGPGRRERHVEVRLLLRLGQGRIHHDRAVRASVSAAERRRRSTAKTASQGRDVRRVPGPDHRPVGQG